MRRSHRRFVFFIALLAIFATPAPPARAQSSTLLPPGVRAPRYVLKDVYGQSFYSASYTNRPALIVFVMVSDSISSPLIDLLDIEERYRNKNLAVVVIGYAQPIRGYRMAPSVKEPLKVKIDIPVLLDTQDVARAFGVSKDNAVFFIDDLGLVRGSAAFVGAPPGFLHQKAALWLRGGIPPEKMGWRGDLAVTWSRVVEQRFGLVSLLSHDPELAARELRSFASRDLRVFLSAEGESENIVLELEQLTREAMNDWHAALPQLSFKLTDQRAAADLIIEIKPSVLDRRDPRGLRTLCSYFRTLSEAQPPESATASRVTTLAQIARHHDEATAPGHSRDALKKLLTSAVGFGLGLAQREDPQSVMSPNADAALITRPSADDLVIVRHLWAHLGLQLCNALIRVNKLDEAARALELIPPGMPHLLRAQDAIKQARNAATK